MENIKAEVEMKTMGGLELNPRKAWRFLAVTYMISWGCWIPAAISGQGLSNPWISALFFAGALGPMLAALINLYIEGNPPAWRDYWERLIDMRRLRPAWVGVTLFCFPLLTILSMLLAIPFSGGGIAAELAAIFSTPLEYIRAPLSLLPFILVTFFFGPLPEEMGWRGYALDHLQARYSALVASLILGAAWSLWHLPMYLIVGTYQHSLGLGSALFWLFSLGMLPQTVLMTWVYNNTQRSTLLSALFHFAINFSGEFFEPTTNARLYQLILTILLAALVIWMWPGFRGETSNESLQT